MKYTITIAIPAYNVRKYIYSCINSALTQSVSADELIIINDGSTDETKAIIEEIVLDWKKIPEFTQSEATENDDDDPAPIRIRPTIKVIHKSNGGLCSARNAGLDNATSDYILYLDGDDVLCKDTIKQLHSTLENSHYDIIQGKMAHFIPGKRWIPGSYAKLCSTERDVIPESTPELFDAMSVPTKLLYLPFLRRNNIRFYEGVMMTEDHYVSLQCFYKTTKIHTVKYEIFHYRQDNIAASRKSAKVSHYYDMYKIQLELKNIIPPESLYYKRFLSYDIITTGINRLHTFLNEEEKKEAFQILVKTIRLIDTKFDSSVYGKINRKMLSSLRAGQYKKTLLLSLYKIKYWPCIKKHTDPIQKRVRQFLNKICSPIKKYVGTMQRRISERIKKFIYRLTDKRAFWYNLFSLLPIINNSIVIYLFSNSNRNFQEVFTLSFYECVEKKGVYNVIKIYWKRNFFYELYAMYNISRAKTIFIDAHCRFLYGVKRRKKQNIVQLWHAGGAFKKFGCDMYDDTFRKQNHAQQHMAYSHFLTSSKALNKYYASAFGLKEDKAIAIGTLRTDLLYKVKDNAKTVLENFIARYPHAKDKKILIFAPTFRNQHLKLKEINKETFLFDFDRFHERYGSQYLLCLRLHPNITAPLIISSESCRSIIDVTNYPQEELLACADAMIADYSSIIFDFCFFEKPLFFYAPDLQNYLGERGFYFPYRDFVPGDIFKSDEKLMDALEDLPIYSSRAKKFWDMYMTACDGAVTQKLLDLTNSLMKV